MKSQLSIFDQKLATGVITPDPPLATGVIQPTHIIVSLPAQIIDPNITTIFTDGGVILRNPSPFGGSWAWVGTDGQGNQLSFECGLVVVPSGKEISNNTTEFMAITRALEAMKDGWMGMVFSDSENAIKRFKALRKYGSGIACDGLPPNVKMRGFVAQARMGEIAWAHCDGHPTKAELATGLSKKGRVVSLHNVECDRLCTELQENWKRTYEGKSRIDLWRLVNNRGGDKHGTDFV